MMLYYCNLRKGDLVLDVRGAGREAEVSMQPRESALKVALIYTGTVAQRYVFVGHLRLIVDGKPEDVPPVDGEIPSPKEIEAPEPVRKVKMPHGSEELRNDIHKAIARYPQMTFVETVGVLELVKMDMGDMLRATPDK